MILLYLLLASLYTAWASLERIQTFLVREEKPSELDELYSDTPPDLIKLDDDDDDGHSPLVVIKNASFGWDKETAVLKDVSLSLKAGLHMVVGSVAAVRSSASLPSELWLKLTRSAGQDNATDVDPPRNSASVWNPRGQAQEGGTLQRPSVHALLLLTRRSPDCHRYADTVHLHCDRQGEYPSR